MGFLGKLFGRGKEDPANRSDFEAAGAICARCGAPIPRAQLALDSGQRETRAPRMPTQRTHHRNTTYQAPGARNTRANVIGRVHNCP